MDQITPKSIDALMEYLVSHKAAKTKSRKNFDQELRKLRAMFNWYQQVCDHKFVNPLMRRHWEKSRFKRVKSRRPDYFIPEQDVLRWLEFLRDQTKDQTYYQLALFMIYTGARVGEACGLTWDKIDFGAKYARIEQIIWWDYKTREPQFDESCKTEGSIRAVPLADPLITVIASIQRKSEYVFSRSNGTPLRYPAIQNAFNRGFKELGMEWRSTHILRHTAATLGLKATRDPRAVQAQLGHKSARQTEHYAKIVALLDHTFADKTAELLSQSREKSREVLAEGANTPIENGGLADKERTLSGCKAAI